MRIKSKLFNMTTNKLLQQRCIKMIMNHLNASGTKTTDKRLITGI